MGLRINIPLPGPFNLSTRATPRIGRSAHQIRRAASHLAAARPPSKRQPAERRSTADESGFFRAFFWSLGVAILIAPVAALILWGPLVLSALLR